jgi:hypothetical protein
MPEGNHDECNSLYRLTFSVFRNTGQLCLGNFACVHPGAILARADRSGGFMRNI